MRVIVHADASGPLFDGEARAQALLALDRAKRDLGDIGSAELRAWVMDKTGRATGRYQAGIITSVLSFSDIKIWDPVVYGPWLEGVSERNRSTRFKGYHLWRITRAHLSRMAKDVLQKRLDEVIGRMGGG